MKRNNGFTLMELMVTVGLISVVAVGVIRLQSTMNKSVKAAAQKYEVIQIHSELSQIIGDPYNCEVMLKGKTLPLLTLGGTNGTDLTSINKVAVKFKNGGTSLIPERDASGNLIVESTKVVTYAGEICKIGTHNILDTTGKYPCVYGYGTSSTIAIKQIKAGMLNSKAATIAITYRKGPAAKKGWSALSAAAKSSAQQSSQYGRLEETKTIPIAVETDTTGKVISCNSEVSDINETFCISLGGVWINDKCKNISIESDSPGTLPAITAVGDLETEDMAITQNLNVTGNTAITGTQTVTGTTTLEDTLAVKKNATMQSNLEVTGNSTAAAMRTTGAAVVAGGVNANKLCINGACKSGWSTSCGSSQYQYGIDSNGNALCKPFPNTTCPAGQYIVKVNSDGSAVCGAVPKIVSEVTCPTGYAIQSADIQDDANGTPKTCVTVRFTGCVWVYSGWVGTTNYSTTARGGTNAICPSGKFATGARVDTTNSSTTDALYSSGAVRVGVYCCTPTLAP